MNIYNYLSKNYINFRGWKTKRKIVVIESDDWGSIRMSSKEAYLKLLERGIPVNKSYFTRYDSLETNEDLNELKEVLSKYKDINSRNPVITLNCVVANPNYPKIIESDFKYYFFETIDTSFKNNIIDSSGVLKVYHDSVKNNQFFKPQFHGREHLNVRKFMHNLSNRYEYDLVGADFNCLLGLTKGSQIKSRKFYHSENYMAGFESLDSDHELEIESIIHEGLKIFENTFGYKSKSFVAQSLIWGNYLLPVLKENQIEYIQGAQQFIPKGIGTLEVINNFSGSKTVLNQTLWRRNASFEPSSNHQLNWVDKCLKEIEIAFKWNAPAVINSHRVNFIGSIDKENRSKSLLQFSNLLKKIKEKWSDVEFLSSDELGDLMTKK